MNTSFLLQQQQQQLRLARRPHQAAALWRGVEQESSDSESSDSESTDDDTTDDDIVSAPFLLRATQSTHSLRIDTRSASATINNLPAETAASNNIVLTTNDTDHPPTPWGSCKAKQTIIDELKDETSNIYLYVGHYTLTNFGNVNFKLINKTYAGSKYKPSLFRENVKRLLKHLLNKTGPFKVEEAAVEPWYTSVSKVSKAYSLLFLLYMDPSKTCAINNMSAEEVWESHPQFQLYELEKFRNYNKNMKKLTSKRRNMICEEEASYHRDMLKLPKETQTTRGYPFWNDHLASELLSKDEMTGVAKELKPIKLWQLRKEYQDFPLVVFRKHIYQERNKQLAAPFWQHRRNKNAKKQFEEAQEMMREWHQDKFDRNMDEMMDDWGRVNLKS